MGAVLALVGLGVAGAATMAAFGLVWLLLKLVFLPIRLAFGAVRLVLGLVFGVVGGLLLLVLAPVVAVGLGGVALLVLVAGAFALLLPLLPFVLLAVIVWSFMKRPVAA